MKKEDFIYNDNCETPLNGSSHWESPSNIALVKYWGKSDVQIPKNTSISFTLNKCLTSTKLEFVKKTNSSELIDFDIYYLYQVHKVLLYQSFLKSNKLLL